MSAELAERPTASPDATGVQSLSNGREGNGKRLTMKAMSLIMSLADAGKTQTEIAQVVGCSIPTVSRTLDNLTDNRALARRQLEAAAPQLVKTIKQSKDAATALRALGKLDVVREDGPQSTANIAIVIGQPGQPLMPPSIAIQALSPVDNSASALSPQREIAVSRDMTQAKATPIEGVSPPSVA
jgi:DNA-binding MarR family transcriptional regulator